MPKTSKTTNKTKKEDNYKLLNDLTTSFGWEITRPTLWKETSTYTFNLVTDNGINLYGLRLILNKDNEYFIAYPSREGKDGKYYSHFFVKFEDAEIKEIIDLITNG